VTADQRVKNYSVFLRNCMHFMPFLCDQRPDAN